MSFSEKTETLVNALVQAEYENACKQFGEKFNSLHEGYAVLLEEVEEVQNEVDKIKGHLDHLWEKIKNQVDINNINSFICFIESPTFYAIKELAQVGAVLWKIKNTISPVEKTENIEKTPKFVWHDYPNEEPKHQQKVLIQDRYGNIYTASYYTDKKDTCFSVQSLTYGLQGCEFIANKQVEKWCDFPLEVEE